MVSLLWRGKHAAPPTHAGRRVAQDGRNTVASTPNLSGFECNCSRTGLSNIATRDAKFRKLPHRILIRRQRFLRLALSKPEMRIWFINWVSLVSHSRWTLCSSEGSWESCGCHWRGTGTLTTHFHNDRRTLSKDKIGLTYQQHPISEYNKILYEIKRYWNSLHEKTEDLLACRLRGNYSQEVIINSRNFQILIAHLKTVPITNNNLLPHFSLRLKDTQEAFSWQVPQKHHCFENRKPFSFTFPCSEVLTKGARCCLLRDAATTFAAICESAILVFPASIRLLLK